MIENTYSLHGSNIVIEHEFIYDKNEIDCIQKAPSCQDQHGYKHKVVSILLPHFFYLV